MEDSLRGDGTPAWHYEPKQSCGPRCGRQSFAAGAGAPMHRPELRTSWVHLSVVAAGAMALYAVTMPPTVTLEDSGLFVMSCANAGVSHPPGYPLHSLLGKLFSVLPLGSVAVRIHLLSAFFGALTCAALWLAAVALTGRRVAGYVAALGYATALEPWAQAIIAEVYSLNTFLFFALVVLALRFRSQPERRTASVAALLYGLALANHWPLLLLGSPALAAIVWPRRWNLAALAPRAALWLAAGLSPYLFLVLRSLADPPISFYGPLDSLERVAYLVLRSGYAGVDDSATAGAWDRLQFAGHFVQQLAAQFTPLGAAFAAAGFALQWRRWPREVCGGLLLGFLGSSVALLLLLHRDFDDLQAAVVKVYPLVAYGIGALWLGLGVTEAGDRLSARFGVRWAGPLLGGVTVALALGVNARIDVRRDDTWARDYARAVLEGLEPDAVLLVHGDSDTGPIGYLHHVEGVRPDVQLYNDQGLVFRNRLFRAWEPRAQRQAALEAFVARTQRPVYFTGELDLPYGTVDFGLYRQVDKAAPKGALRYAVARPLLEYFERLEAQDPPADAWVRDHRNLLIARYAQVFGPVVYLSGDAQAAQAVRPWLERAVRHFHGKLGAVESLATRGEPGQLLAWLDEAEAQAPPGTSKLLRGRLHYLRGMLLARRGDLPAAVASFERSVDIHPDRRNGAVLALLQLHAAAGDRVRAEALRSRFSLPSPRGGAPSLP